MPRFDLVQTVGARYRKNSPNILSLGCVMTQEDISIKELGDGTPVFKVWKAYEDVAMHFNDLLLRLRIQALAGVAALAILASIFSNVRTFNFQGTWIIAAACFFGLTLIWGAICALDLLYYNRLLVGSVAAIRKIEELSKTDTHATELDLSTHIEQAVRGNGPKPMLWGVALFYGIVFVTLLAGLVATTYSALNYPPPEIARVEEGRSPTASESPDRRGAPVWNPLRKPQ